MSTPHLPTETRVAVLVDCDNTTPDILDFALRVVAQFGRAVTDGKSARIPQRVQNRWPRLQLRQALFCPGQMVSFFLPSAF